MLVLGHDGKINDINDMIVISFCDGTYGFYNIRELDEHFLKRVSWITLKEYIHNKVLEQCQCG
jgi:hypothetical protein